MMMSNAIAFVALTLGMLFVSGSAFAGEPTAAVPEPLSLTLLAGGIAALVAVKRMHRK